MKFFFFLFILFFPYYALCSDNVEEKTIVLKYRLAKDIIPYLTPHLHEDGRISGHEKNITIRTRKSNIDELFIIIGDLDRHDYLQLIISITMNIQAVHNVNTRSIQVGSNTWTKINYGITYSKRIREKSPNGNLIEKIKYVKVIESFQIFTQLDKSNKSLSLKLRPSQNELTDNGDTLTIDTIEINELADEDLQIKLEGKINEWINLGNAINTLYLSSNEDEKIILERQQLTRNLGIKVQLLQ